MAKDNYKEISGMVFFGLEWFLGLFSFCLKTSFFDRNFSLFPPEIAISFYLGAKFVAFFVLFLGQNFICVNWFFNLVGGGFPIEMEGTGSSLGEGENRKVGVTTGNDPQ